MKKILILCLAVILVLLSACSTQNITYELSGNVMCDIQGYDAAGLSYILDTKSLYFAGPNFLGDFFKGITTEGSAELNGDVVAVSFTRHDDPNSGAICGASIYFEVDVKNGTVANVQSTAFEKHTIELTEAEMLEIGEKLAEVIRGVEAYVAKAQK